MKLPQVYSQDNIGVLIDRMFEVSLVSLIRRAIAESDNAVFFVGGKLIWYKFISNNKLIYEMGTESNNGYLFHIIVKCVYIAYYAIPPVDEYRRFIWLDHFNNEINYNNDLEGRGENTALIWVLDDPDPIARAIFNVISEKKLQSSV